MWILTETMQKGYAKSLDCESIAWKNLLRKMGLLEHQGVTRTHRASEDSFGNKKNRRQTRKNGPNIQKQLLRT